MVGKLPTTVGIAMVGKIHKRNVSKRNVSVGNVTVGPRDIPEPHVPGPNLMAAPVQTLCPDGVDESEQDDQVGRRRVRLEDVGVL